MGYITQSQLADLIEKGLQTEGVVEDSEGYLHKPWNDPDRVHACAVGLAFVGLVGNAEEAHENYWNNRNSGFSPSQSFGAKLVVPYTNMLDISYDHFNGMTAREIVKKLRQGGYEWNRSLNVS